MFKGLVFLSLGPGSLACRVVLEVSGLRLSDFRFECEVFGLRV